MPLNAKQQQEVLENAKKFFREKIAENHKANTSKCKKLSEFRVNPFLHSYLSYFFAGNASPENLAKVLLLPRVLGTSITTSMGSHMQNFCHEVLGGIGSATKGLDLEFVDATDGRKKYCQAKLGPDTINRDDVETVDQHFTEIKNRARVNKLPLQLDDLIVGVFYGTHADLNGHYLALNKRYPVYVGQEFWYRLTGNDTFYHQLGDAVGTVALDVDGTALLEEVTQALANDIAEAKAKKVV
jgi:hypothetical protein